MVQRRPSLWRSLDTAARFAWPAAVMLLGLLLIGLPFGLPGQAELRPAYAMACVFFWSLYRPSSMPAPIVALTGIFLDLLGLSPLGLWAVLLLLLQGATLASRRRLIPRRFYISWLSFTAGAAFLSLLAWLLQSLLDLTLLPVLPPVMVAFAAAGLYPALAGLFIRAHRGTADTELA